MRQPSGGQLLTGGESWQSVGGGAGHDSILCPTGANPKGQSDLTGLITDDWPVPWLIWPDTEPVALRTVSAAVLADLVGREPLTRPLPATTRRPTPDADPRWSLPEGVRLPSERELAARIELSRSTVAAAYADLRASASELPAGRGQFRRPGRGTRRPDQREAAGSLLMTYTRPPPYPGSPRRTRRRSRSYRRCWPGTGIGRRLPVLRQAWPAGTGGAGCPPILVQIVVTGGALAAINLVTRTLLGPGDRVLVESPSYANALNALRRHGARLVPAPMTETGWDVDQSWPPRAVGPDVRAADA